MEGETGDELEDVHGFVFSKLKSLHPDKGDKLAEMKQYLLGKMDQVDVPYKKVQYHSCEDSESTCWKGTLPRDF